MRTFRQICLGGSGLALMALIAGLGMREPGVWQPAAVAASAGLAFGLGAVRALKGYQFTAWIITAVIAGMIYPGQLLHPADLDLRNKWLILFIVQAVMFGMGTQMKLTDFAGVAKMPLAVLIGVVGQFTIMPLVGFAITKALKFPPEIAAGIILIGSCSAGLASNVMTFMARANLALSVTMTSITTMLAPLMTPLWMKLLAGQLVEVKFFNMMMEIIKFVIVPIGAALLHDYLKRASAGGRRIVLGVAGVGAAWLVFLTAGGWHRMTTELSADLATLVGVLGFLLAAVVAGVVYHQLTRWWTRLDGLTPLASMGGIIYFTAVTTAAGRDNLLQVGALLFVAAAMHNLIGYCFAYGMSRVCRLDKNSARAVAFEVGLQNGAMASGLAGAMGKLGTVGLASAIFSPWMNISGSMLANYWRRKPVQETAPDSEKENSVKVEVVR